MFLFVLLVIHVKYGFLAEHTNSSSENMRSYSSLFLSLFFLLRIHIRSLLVKYGFSVDPSLRSQSSRKQRKIVDSHGVNIEEGAGDEKSADGDDDDRREVVVISGRCSPASGISPLKMKKEATPTLPTTTILPINISQDTASRSQS